MIKVPTVTATAAWPARAAALFAVLAPGPAGAVDHCVSCTGPTASYVCEVNGLAETAATGLQGQLLCIKSLAAEGGHQTCSITRNAAAACAGPLRSVGMPLEGRPTDSRAGMDPAPAPTRTGAAPPTAASPEPAKEPEPSAKAAPSRSVLQKAGDNIGLAASKTWACMSSLFKDC